MVRPVAYRLIGSPDLYEHKEREPEESINFITCHDGLTLNDLVSYNRKHNEENGEDNRDGTDNNLSWNCGAEGPTQDPVVEQLRNRQVKNFLTLTLLSVGTPMLLMGDEMRRTQHGNNNAYCQNNETSWLNWELLTRHADIHRFVKQLISLRLMAPIERSDMTLNELLRRQPVQWHGVRLGAPDWSHDSHTLAATVRLPGDQVVLHLMVNAYWKALQFEIPAVSEAWEPWRRCVDTFLDSPDDICDWAKAPMVSGTTYVVQPRCVALLVAEVPGRTEQSERL
jgi:glycogen operon protein